MKVSLRAFLLLTVLFCISASSFASSPATNKEGDVRCTDSSGNLDPNAFFFIQSYDVGHIVTLGGVKYRVTESQAGTFGDFMPGQLVTLQGVQNPDAKMDIVCPFYDY